MPSRGVVVEFQGFKDHALSYIVKELAFSDVDHDYQCKYLFQPPYYKDFVAKSYKCTNQWLTDDHHLQWNDGDIPYDKLGLILNCIYCSYDNIYTKGSEKLIFLERYNHQKKDIRFVNLDALDENLFASNHSALVDATKFANILKYGMSMILFFKVQF